MRFHYLMTLPKKIAFKQSCLPMSYEVRNNDKDELKIFYKISIFWFYFIDKKMERGKYMIKYK